MAEPFVKPDVQAFLAMLAAQPRPDFTAALLAQIRLMPADQMAMLDLPVGELAVDRTLAMPGVGPGPGGEGMLRLFDARAERAAGPVVLFCHGGGFVVGSSATHAGMAATIARALDLPVISVDYRLAPEQPWPAAPDDAEAAARWVAGNGAALGREASGLVLCGDSAGGNLALVTALALRDRPAAVPVRFVLAIYPGTDQREGHASKTEFADGYGLESINMQRYLEHYRPDPEHWRASPLVADPAGLPPMMIATAALDPLRDEGRAFAAAAVAAGVTTCYWEAAGTIHGFASYRRVIPSAVRDFDALLDVARAMIAGL